MEVTLLPEAALEDAKSIDTIIDDITKSLEELDKEIRSNIPEHLETQWSKELSDNWNKYYTGEIKSALNGMSLSAVNLKKAVQVAEHYSKS